jgi:hypothetical protein
MKKMGRDSKREISEVEGYALCLYLVYHSSTHAMATSKAPHGKN